jgi:CRISPR-associated endonuclease/helicase Cas3
MHYAHSLEGMPTTAWEPLPDHLAAVGATAGGFASWFDAAVAGCAMGLLHDIGKCSAAYQRYIATPRAAGGPKGPDHSTAGAVEAMARFGGKSGPSLGKLLAYGLAGHHGGLMDGRALAARAEKALEPYAGWEAYVAGLPAPGDLQQGLAQRRRNGIVPGFELSFLARMLFSCLVDADFLETEKFYAQARGEQPPARGGILAAHHLETVRAYMQGRRGGHREVDRLRTRVLDHAVGKAALPPGLFTLTVPTGGGKTLTSLNFALEHAQAHGLRRVIYVIPFTSIIEQTAQVFREEVKLGDAVLEHHSAFDWDTVRPGTGDDSEEEGAAGLAKLRRDTENWDAPVVVTTAVQFFESLFAARTSKARKLHNLAKSVIVLDEAQSIPVKLLRPCMAAIDELARNYGASVVLCTATQPALRRQDGALPEAPQGAIEALDIPGERELAPDPPALYEKLRRVAVEWRRDPVADAEIVARFAERPQMLCIVNSRAHARDLFELLRGQGQAGAVHLTTLMCARHRREVLAKAREDLEQERPVRLVATSLIEAGVDISFPEVWRAAAGLSSIMQTAGRCNRSGELGDLGTAFGRAVVFESAEHKVPPMIEAFYGPARQLLRREGIDVLGLGAITAYYRELYWRQGYDALDSAQLGGERFRIAESIRLTAPSLDFPFARVSDAFRMIDDVMDPVIVPWDDEARDAIAAIHHAELPPAGARRRLQQYVVPVPAKARGKMLASGAVQPIRPEDYGDRFMVLESPSLYDPELGLRLDDPTWRTSESNIFS